jgi:hypothetical protein
MSLKQQDTEASNSSYVSTGERKKLSSSFGKFSDNFSLDETTTLLQEQQSPAITSDDLFKETIFQTTPKPNGPTSPEHALQSNTTTHSTPSNKPILIRQDRTYLASPQLSTTGGSEESAGAEDDLLNNARSAPDIELNCRVETPKISISNSCDGDEHSHSMQLVPSNRCRTCIRFQQRRSSTTPSSMHLLHRSLSKESVRSALPGHLSPNTSLLVQHQHHSTTIPPVLVTSSPSARDRIIRQSSQPETCMSGHCHHHPTASLRQLKEPSDPISNIATETLRIAGVIRPFKQVSFRTS